MNDSTEHQHDAEIRTYLSNRMSAEAKAQFEIRMLEEPELLERVQLLEALGLDLAQEEALLLAPDAAPAHASVVSFAGWLRQPLSIAASVLVAALGLSLLRSVPETASVPNVVAVDTLLLLEARRDEGMPAFSGSGPYLLQVDVGLGAQAGAFDVVLHDVGSGAVLMRQDGIEADLDGWIRLIYTDALNGTYRLELVRADDAAQTLSYPFAVEAP